MCAGPLPLRFAVRTPGLVVSRHDHRHDALPVTRTRAEDAVVAGGMESRRGHQRRELLHELARLEDDVRGAVAPAVLQAVEEPPVAETRESLGGHGRARHVAREALEAPSIPRRDGDVGVQAHAVDAGAALTFERGEGLGIDAIADTEEAPP